MRKYIYSIFLLGLFSCQEEGVVQYTQEKDGLQFSANSSEDMTCLLYTSPSPRDCS